MPVDIELPDRRTSGRQERETAVRDGLVIGIVNNMPDSALRSTERQFDALLSAACGTQDVVIRYTSIPEVPRGAAALARLRADYWPIGQFLESPIDGLIVTGNEPRAASLPDEPYWARLVDLFAFSQTKVASSVWSCLAAHAAVLHRDGIKRRRLPHKHSGVFTHEVRADHPLTQGLPVVMPTPHSRWNELAEVDLVGAGYEILSASRESGVDVFVREERVLTVFLQGHPEYERETLLREYRRDVLRFVSGETPDYPNVPVGYLSAEGEGRLAEFRELAMQSTRASVLDDFPYLDVAAGISERWKAPAVRLWENWLAWVADRR